MDCSPPGSSVHGVLQTRTLEWAVMPSSRGSSQPRDQTQVSHTTGEFFTVSATREALFPNKGGLITMSILKEFSPGVHWKDCCWSWNSNTLATSCEELTHWKRPWCWQGLGAGEEGDDRGWDGWMASPTRWAWVWVNSRSWWWTGRPGVLRFMGSQGVGHDWATELNWTELLYLILKFISHITVMKFYRTDHSKLTSLILHKNTFKSIYITNI